MTETSQTPDTSVTLPPPPTEGDTQIEQVVQVEVAEKREDIPMNEVLRLGRLIESDRYTHNRQAQNRARQDGVPFVPSDTDLLNDHTCLLEVVQILETKTSDSEDTVRTTYHLTQETIRVICEAYGIQLTKKEDLPEPAKGEAKLPKKRAKRKRAKEPPLSSVVSVQQGTEPSQDGPKAGEGGQGAEVAEQPADGEAVATPTTSEATDKPTLEHQAFIARREAVLAGSYNVEGIKELGFKTKDPNDARETVNLILTRSDEAEMYILMRNYIASIWDVQSAEAALNQIHNPKYEPLHYAIATETAYESTALCAAKGLQSIIFIEAFFKMPRFESAKRALVVQYLKAGNSMIIQTLSQIHLLSEDNLQLVNTLHPEWIATQSAEPTALTAEVAGDGATSTSDAETSTGTPTLEVGETPDHLEPLDPPMIFTGVVGRENRDSIVSLGEYNSSADISGLHVITEMWPNSTEIKTVRVQLDYKIDDELLYLEKVISVDEDPKKINRILIQNDTSPYAIYGQARVFYEDEKPKVAFALQVCRKKNIDETREPAPPQPKPPVEDINPIEPVAAPAAETVVSENELKNYTLLKTRECNLPLENVRWEEEHRTSEGKVVKWGVHHSDEGIRLWVYDPVEENTPASGGALSRESEVIFKHGHFAVKGQIMDINGQEQAVIHLYQAKSTTAAADASSSNTEPPTDAAKDADTPKQPPQVPVAEVVVPPPVQSQEIHGLRKDQEPPQTEYELSRPAPPEGVTPFNPPFVIEDMVGFAQTDNYDRRLACPGLSRLEVRVRNGKQGSSKKGQVMVDVLDGGSGHEYDLFAGRLVFWKETHTNDIDINIRNGGNKVAVWGRARFVEDGGAKKLIYSLEVGLVNQDDEINAKPKPIVDPTPAEPANPTPLEATPAPPPEPALVDETPTPLVARASGQSFDNDESWGAVRDEGGVWVDDEALEPGTTLTSQEIGSDLSNIEIIPIPNDLEHLQPPFIFSDQVRCTGDSKGRRKNLFEERNEGNIYLGVSGVPSNDRFAILTIYLDVKYRGDKCVVNGNVNISPDEEDYVVRIEGDSKPFVVIGKARLVTEVDGTQKVLFVLEACRKKGAKDTTATTEPSIKSPTGDAKPAQHAQVPVREKVSTGAPSQAVLAGVRTELSPAPQPDLFSNGLPKGLRKDGLSSPVAYLEIPQLTDGGDSPSHSYRLDMPESNLYFTMSYKPDTRETHMEWSNTAMGLKHEVEGVRYDPEIRLYYASHGYMRDKTNRIVRIEFQPPDAENMGFVRAQDFQELSADRQYIQPHLRELLQQGLSLDSIAHMSFQEYREHFPSYDFSHYNYDRLYMLELIGESSELKWGLSNGSKENTKWESSIDRLHDTRDYVGLVSVLYLLTDKKDVVYILRHFASDNQMEVFGDLIAGSDLPRAKVAIDVLMETGHTQTLAEIIQGTEPQPPLQVRIYAHERLLLRKFTKLPSSLRDRFRKH